MKKVLVTGANSGIGRKIVDYLIDRDFFVYACARKAEDIENLNNLPDVTA